MSVLDKYWADHSRVRRAAVTESCKLSARYSRSSSPSHQRSRRELIQEIITFTDYKNFSYVPTYLGYENDDELRFYQRLEPFKG